MQGHTVRPWECWYGTRVLFEAEGPYYQPLKLTPPHSCYIAMLEEKGVGTDAVCLSIYHVLSIKYLLLNIHHQLLGYI